MAATRFKIPNLGKGHNCQFHQEAIRSSCHATGWHFFFNGDRPICSTLQSHRHGLLATRETGKERERERESMIKERGKERNRKGSETDSDRVSKRERERDSYYYYYHHHQCCCCFLASRLGFCGSINEKSFSFCYGVWMQKP